jgi:lipoprotein-anchoring transpeptidase ErfK/SrfK
MAQQPRLSERIDSHTAREAPREVWIPAAHAENHKQKWPSSSKLLFASIFLLLSLALLVGMVAVTLLFYSSPLIFPGTRVVDIPVGLKTTQEAAANLAQTIPQRDILLIHSSGAWPVKVADLGLTMNIEETMKEAYDLGRTLPGLQRIAAGNWYLNPHWSLDSAQAAAFLSELAPQVQVPAVNAKVIVENGDVIELPAREGIALDMEMTLSYLRENPTEIVRTGRLPLAAKPIAAEITDAGVFASEARRFLSKTVTIRAYDPVRNESDEWQLRPRDWQKWLNLVVAPGESDPFTWVVDENAAQQFLSDGWPWLGEERYLDAEVVVPAVLDVITSGKTTLDARVFHRPSQHTVRPGESFSSIGFNYGFPYPWIQQANPGVESLSVGDVVTVPSPDVMLPLPVVPNKRIIVSLSEQRTRVYENGELLWDWPSSTGINNSPTSPGIFQLQSHVPEAYASNWDLYMPNFMGIYRPVPTSDFMNGFHGFPTRDGFNLLWTGDLGHPVTYGCILLSSTDAQQLYNWAEEGIVVEIQR